MKTLLAVVFLIMSVAILFPVYAQDCVPGYAPYYTDFGSPALDSCWSWIREDASHWNLSARPGWLRIITQPGTMYESSDARNLLLRPRPLGDFSFSTRIAIRPTQAYQGGGLMLYRNDQEFVRIIRQRNAVSEIAFQSRMSAGVNFELANSDTLLYLRLSVAGTQVTGEWSPDEITWHTVGSCSFAWLDSSFSVGVNVCNGNYQGQTAPQIPADFDFFRITGDSVPPPPPPEECGPGAIPYLDSFSATTLDSCWSWVREDPSHWSLTSRPGWMTIVTQPGTMYESSDARNLLLRHRPVGDFSFSTRISIHPTQAYQGGGLMLYLSDSHFLRIMRQQNYASPELVFQSSLNDGINFEIQNSDTLLSLRMSISGTQVIGEWSRDETNWFEVGRCNFSWIDSTFSVGLNACNGNYQGQTAPQIPASFDYFRMDGLTPQGSVCGDVSGVWTLAGSPYLVTCDVTVPAGQTLEIQPGVQVIFTGPWAFTVNGTLNAHGTEADSIRFTINLGSHPDGWRGLRLMYASDSSIVSYCIVENAYWPDPNPNTAGGGIVCWGCSPLVEHSTIQGCNSVRIGGGIKLLDSNARIRYCHITNNYAPYGGGIESGALNPAGAFPELYRCVIDYNSAGQGGGIGCWNGTNLRVTNCTIVANHGDDAGGIRLCCGSTAIITSSIFARNTIAAVAIRDNSTAEIDYSCFRQNSVIGNVPVGFGRLVMVNGNADSCDVHHNIFLDPQFVDYSARDYHLQAGSPCINAGDPALPYDPDGTIADMGAFYHAMSTGGIAYVSLLTPGPPNWGYRLNCTGGTVSKIVFTDFCPGTTGSVSGAAAATWQVMPLGDGNNGDSIIFVASIPMTVGYLDTFKLSHPTCSDQIRWCVNDSCSEVDGPLPVELLNFSALLGDGEVTLLWSTASETDVASFEILRDGVRILNVPAAGGSSTGANYRRSDTGLTNGQQYRYTLNAVDLNGVREALAEVNATPVAGGVVITDYALYQNYPNPFNPKTTISFDLLESGHVNLTVFNMVGQKVLSLVNERMASGRHHVSFDAERLPSGLYFYRLDVNGYAFEKKMVLMK